MKFQRTPEGVYRADGSEFVYRIQREGSSWMVAVYTLETVAGVILAGERIDVDLVATLGLAKAYANGYETNALATEKPFLNRSTRAIHHAYEVDA